MNGISALTKGAHQSSLVPSTIVRTHLEVAINEPESGLSPGTKSASTLILDFQPPELDCGLDHSWKLEAKCMTVTTWRKTLHHLNCLQTQVCCSLLGIHSRPCSPIRANCHQKPSVCLQAACPESWIGFQRKCFYFSDDTKNWTSSQRFCDSQDADLAQVESFQELNFLLRYKGPSDHWIGLSREQGQPWKWINGTEWTRQFPILGAGECAYLNDKGASSARHYTERKWICSKSDIHV
ncbi:C-type lectin domain family 2 member D isoform X2 [Symphalangus syndactylus]|uniref:C-type lectin domain family 2 member D isoform X2 n=1 Tax=Symphalangus syndactylus TaxID=9590 RepID=UPI003007E511